MHNAIQDACGVPCSAACASAEILIRHFPPFVPSLLLCHVISHYSPAV